ncbi:hypothetical protein V5J34_003205 [Endozoicomonas sp. NE35]
MAEELDFTIRQRHKTDAIRSRTGQLAGCCFCWKLKVAG